ncbi:MAG: copper ion binding protein [Clostridia bacterium]|jgi:copper ion binding protein|nr:copper ion binding protein [Clostridia bacterium]
MEKRIIVEGMSCGHCVRHVKEALEELEGITQIDVDLESKTATIKGFAEDKDIKDVIKEAGYEVISITVQ